MGASTQPGEPGRACAERWWATLCARAEDGESGFAGGESIHHPGEQKGREVLGGYQSTQGLNGNSINGSINCSQNGSSACPMYVTTESSATVFTVADWGYWNPSMYVTRNGVGAAITTSSLS